MEKYTMLIISLSLFLSEVKLSVQGKGVQYAITLINAIITQCYTFIVCNAHRAVILQYLISEKRLVNPNEISRPKRHCMIS